MMNDIDCRLGICCDRRDRRSCKSFVSFVNFSRKQRIFLQSLRRSTRFTLIVGFYTETVENFTHSVTQLLILMHLHCSIVRTNKSDLLTFSV